MSRKTETRRFGHIPGIEIGTIFQDRADLAKARIHPPRQASISGAADEGADSIVLNGGYEDDEDLGDVIIYTGHGGQDPGGRHVRDQTMTRGNRALAVSRDERLPVRVSRGPRVGSYGPDSGFRYDGLYEVLRYWPDKGRSGFRVWRYRLEAVDIGGLPEAPIPSGSIRPGRKDTTRSSIVRDPRVAMGVKELHGFACQICGTIVDTATGPYAEAAHVKPLGRPDDGPDTPDNVLCLCPNHHAEFDRGGMIVDTEHNVIRLSSRERLGVLRSHARHSISSDYLAYHRDRWEGAD